MKPCALAPNGAGRVETTRHISARSKLTPALKREAVNVFLDNPDQINTLLNAIARNAAARII